MTMSLVISEILSSKGFKWITFGWISFISENIILSENRDYIISNVGSDNYMIIYSVLSTIASSSIAYGYIRHGKQKGLIISQYRGPISLFAGFIFQTTGLIISSQFIPKIQSPIQLQSTIGSDITTIIKNITNLKKTDFKLQCPMDFKSKSKVTSDDPYGVERITRHPAYWALGLISLGPALRTIYFNELIMFGFPVVYAAIGGTHIDYRYKRGSGGNLSPHYESLTSNLPFVALLNGKQSWNDLRNEISVGNALIATSLGIILALRKI